MTADTVGHPTVYAHRGGAALAPENTLGAFRQAHDMFGSRGAWLEMDVQLAADGELVVIHDQTLDRTTDCSGFVADHTSAQLAQCDASEVFAGWSSFEPVPAFEEVLDEGRTSGWRLLVEIKNIPGERNFDPTGRDAALAFVGTVDDTGFPPDRIAVQSFFPTSLDIVKILEPGIRTALLTTSTYGFLALENGAYATARGYDITAPDFTAPDLGAETVAAIQALGREVVPYTVNRPEHIARVARWGVDGIISDHPDRVYAALE